MSVAGFAKSKGVSTQYVYKRLEKAGIKPSALRDPETGLLTDDGLATLIKTLEECQPSTVNHQPSTNARLHQPSTINTHEVDALKEELSALRDEVASLKLNLTDARHRAELAEMRAAASESERDFLRTQLDSAIKATALATMKGIAPQESHQNGLVRRVANAWANLWGKQEKPQEGQGEAE